MFSLTYFGVAMAPIIRLTKDKKAFRIVSHLNHKLHIFKISYHFYM